MKKSEAVKKFDDWLWEQSYKEDFRKASNLEKCELALDFMVKELGMLPPEDPLKSAEAQTPVNWWEPEN